MVVDKRRSWEALSLALWFNAHSDFYYQHLYGDKDTFHIAFRKLAKAYSMVPHPVAFLEGTLCQHDFTGRRIFQHRNRAKWNLMGRNQSVPGFELEEECLGYLSDLGRRWNGRIGRQLNELASELSSLSHASSCAPLLAGAGGVLEHG